MIQEGVNDPAIFKAVFLAGGPGSGKSFIVGKTALTALGMKVVNSDDLFERGLKKAGLDMSPDNIYSPKGQDIRARAKSLTKNKQQNYIDGRLGMVIDGTGKDYDKIVKQAIALRRLGYDIAMIFVNTDEETALKRNQMRARSLPDATVSKMWKDVQKNLGSFQTFFGNFFIIDNSEGSDYNKQVLDVYKKMAAWTKVHPKNKAVTSWIKAQKMNEHVHCGTPDCCGQCDTAIKEDAPAVNTGSIPNPAQTSMGPKFKPLNVTDRRRRKDKHPVVLKRFRKYIESN